VCETVNGIFIIFLSGWYCEKKHLPSYSRALQDSSTAVFQKVVIYIGSLATINRKPRQARKGATVVVDSGAEVLLV